MKKITTLKRVDRLDNALDRFKRAHELLDSQFIARDVVIEVILFGIAMKEHVLLDGPPGCAKSAVAEAIFKAFRYRDASKQVTRFSKMLMVGTTLEELFGAMDIKAFREESRIHFNTAGMLPSAQFAFLDELYRGPDAVLSSLLNLLNERVFTNGPCVVKCPLISAIGTTNFKSDSETISAFNDRWLFQVGISPLETSEQRLRMVEISEKTAGESSELPAIFMEDLELIWKAVAEDTLPSDIVEVYDTLSETVAKKKNGLRVSDRRFVKGAKLLKTAKILSGLDDFSADCFDLLRYILVNPSKEDQAIFDEAFETVIGVLERQSKEEPILAEIESRVKALSARYVEGMTGAKKKALYDDVNGLVISLNGTVSDDEEDGADSALREEFTLPELRVRRRDAVQRLTDLKFSLEKDLGIST